ncbi:MAG: (deoxy)nucleoside triphosphate pyrophosphohydrolase [Vicinamibacterales bacterium]
MDKTKDFGARAHVNVVVVAAVIEQHRRFLVTRRQPGVHLAGMWEFPGGKIDPGESHAAGLTREIREELGVDIEVGELTHETTHAYAERTVAIYFYRCTLQGTPRPLLGQDMQWVGRADLPSLGFPAADSELIDRLVQSEVR